MESLSEVPVEDFERVWDLHDLEMKTNLLLWLTQDLFSDETEKALFTNLKSKPTSIRLEETEKWVGYVLRHGDDFMDGLWEGILYTWDIKELESFFQSMDEVDNQQREAEYLPIEETLNSLKWVNSEVILNWFRNQLQNLLSKVTH